MKQVIARACWARGSSGSGANQRTARARMPRPAPASLPFGIETASLTASPATGILHRSSQPAYRNNEGETACQLLFNLRAFFVQEPLATVGAGQRNLFVAQLFIVAVKAPLTFRTSNPKNSSHYKKTALQNIRQMGIRSPGWREGMLLNTPSGIRKCRQSIQLF